MHVVLFDTVTGETETRSGVDQFYYAEEADDPGPVLVIDDEDGDRERLNAERYNVREAGSEWS